MSRCWLKKMPSRRVSGVMITVCVQACREPGRAQNAVVSACAVGLDPRARAHGLRLLSLGVAQNANKLQEQMTAQQQAIDKLRQEVDNAREQAEAAKAPCRGVCV